MVNLVVGVFFFFFFWRKGGGRERGGKGKAIEATPYGREGKKSQQRPVGGL